MAKFGTSSSVGMLAIARDGDGVDVGILITNIIID